MSIHGAALDGTIGYQNFAIANTNNLLKAEQVFSNDPQQLYARLRYYNDYLELANGVRDLIIRNVTQLQL